MVHLTRSSFLLARFLVLTAALVLAPAAAGAQIPTGAISGRVIDSQNRSIGAATVTVHSPALQGLQSTTTSVNGDYTIRLLPPGTYTIVVEAPGFAAQTHTRVIAATATVTLDVSLEPAGVSEDVTVVGSTPFFANTIESATNLDQQQINLLPNSRSILSAVALAPAVHETGPGGNISIGGAMSFENLFMVNGVQIQDNIRGEPLPLYIEDAIQETTITTSGISAEYGRFSGGIVNALTRSGGNMFSGTFRTSFRNDDWTGTTPFGESKIDSTVPTYEYTFGGPVLRDRTWFFTAGRFEDEQVSRDTGITQIPFVFEQDEKRFEFKGTQALAAGHRVEVDYIGIQRTQVNWAEPSAAGVMDLASLDTREVPQSLLAAHYTGTWRHNLFFEAQYSERDFTFRGAGADTRDRIMGTPLQDRTTEAFWWSPLYCGVCGDEERDNTSLVLKASYFHSSARAGTHQVVVGYDGFNDRMKVDNHQSGSDWHVWTTGSVIDNGTVYPVVRPNESTWIIHWPIRESSQGSNFRTHSLFVNDTWSYNRHLTFNLGLRYDKAAGRDASDNLVANDSMLAPRLGLAWDPTGEGQTTINASYGRYAAALSSGVAGSASPAGTPAILGYYYLGEPINTGGAPYVSSDAALRQIFDWFDASGGASIFFADIPGLASRIDGSLRSPHADEFVVGISHQIGTNASVRLDFVNRSFGDFYAIRTDLTTGQTEDEFGQPYDVGLIQNTNDLERQYRALNAQGSYRLGTDLVAGLSYTLSKLQGNVNGESAGAGPTASGAFQYPEFKDPAWSNPSGDLSADQRHRARVWASWNLPWARSFADMTLGAVQVLQSGTPYSAVTSVLVSPFVDARGYALPPDFSTYYFTARDAYRTEGTARTDVAFTLSKRVGAARGPEVFANVQLFNLFNQFQLANINAINTTVLTAIEDPSLEFFDPFTEAPVEGVHWQKDEKFGQAVGRGAYTQPRTFRFSVGLRF